PKYPDLARKAGIEGIVVITVTIGKDGKVEDAKVFKSLPMLDEAALKAAKKCTFKPAKQRDKTVRVKMNIPFHFRLK
ncbi:MAG: energy transducer TonB, partial [Calditrichaceae bacterium]